MARILITSAPPYINGIKHLGNLVGSMLPADAYARYMRARGHEVMLICATDEHGTPAELAAAQAGQEVGQYCAEMWAVQKRLGEGFRLSFDYFGRSSSVRNHQFTQHLAGRLAEAGLIEERSEKQVYSKADGRFLPDRYIEGTCPECGYERARGDQCENCTKQLDPTDLIDHDWVETNGEPCFVTAVALALLAVLAPHAQSGLSAGTVTVVWTMAIVGAWANQVHKWAHMANAPRLARLLQRTRLALRPNEHAWHHCAPHDSRYCISTGWMNPLLDSLGVWSRLERSLRRAT